MQESQKLQVELNTPQGKFLVAPTKYTALVTGYGGGKTWAGCSKLAKHFLEFPRINAGYFAPTFPQIRDIFYPTIEEALYPWGLSAKVKTGDREVDVYQGRRFHGTIICRSMERPETIIGFKIGRALVDEVDVLKVVKALLAWRKIIARMRYKVAGLMNAVDVTTTPEGFGFVYRQFVEQVRDKPALAGMYGLIQASTYDNEANLPDDYIPSLLASYPEQLIAAYINGQFVNLKTGSVYSAYDRQLNGCDDTITPGEPLFVGMDFNVGKMAAIVHVKRGVLPRAVDEIVNGYDTPDMIRRIKERYWKYEDGDYRQTCAIRVYPDASGDSRKSVNASETDLALLRAAGFGVVVNHSNPPVKDRVNSMNAMFCNALRERRYKVNASTCPTYSGALEQQAWDESGEPDKKSGHDHCFAGETLVHTRAGVFRFDQLPLSGEVIGPFGEYVPYNSARLTGNKITIRIDFDNGLMLRCTPEHKFLTGDGKWIQAKDLMGRECVLSAKQFKSSWGSGITEAESILQTQQKKRAGESIRLFGSNITGRLALVLKSTTKTKTGRIIKSKTLNSLINSAIGQAMVLSSANELPRWGENSSTVQKNGTPRRLAGSGTSSNTSAQKRDCGKLTKRLALSVARFFRLKQASKVPPLSFAQRPASQIIGGKAELTMLIESAQSAGKRFQQTDIARVTNVSHAPLSRQEGVYCLTVPVHECFQIAPGLPIVSNCNDAGGYFINMEYPILARTAQTRSGW